VQHTDTQSFWLLPDAAALAGASTAAGGRPPAQERRGRVGRLLVPLVALLVGAGVAAAVQQAVLPTDPATSAATVEVTGTATPTPEALVLEAEDFLGRPVDAVRAQLEAMGLVVQLEAVSTDNADPDTVVDVAPLSVRLEAGQTVLISYAVAPATPNSTVQTAQRKPAEAVVQPSTVAAPTPSATPTPSVTPMPTPTPTATSKVTSTPTPTATTTPTPKATPTPPVTSSPSTSPAADTGDDEEQHQHGGGGNGRGSPSPTPTPTATATPTATPVQG
jgi:serine/threonine-protein kinase